MVIHRVVGTAVGPDCVQGRSKRNSMSIQSDVAVNLVVGVQMAICMAVTMRTWQASGKAPLQSIGTDVCMASVIVVYTAFGKAGRLAWRNVACLAVRQAI